MTKQQDEYTYQFNGRDGTFDLIEIVSPCGKVLASLYYWDLPDTDEAARVEKSARIICRHLNHWWIGSGPMAAVALPADDVHPAADPTAITKPTAD